MCGITGFFSPSGFPAQEATLLVRAMATAIIARGPDSSGEWVDGDAGIALGHRRLAILDLSAAGHQPMVSDSGRYVLSFNGEIYNHLELRAELGAHAWRGHSDTETLLAAIECWGVEATLKKSVGMFAIALWDRTDRFLFLARDRIGEKPLYYGWQGDVFLFGSELKALRSHPGFAPVVWPDALGLYLRHGYIPPPYSIYAGIHKLKPGTMLRLSANQAVGSPPLAAAYWSLAEVAVRSREHPFNGSDREAVTALDERLAAAVRLQMVADVPLGAFLSGGIDSSLIAALMQSSSSRPIKTFTIGFMDQKNDESAHALEVARHLGTEHTELFVTPDDALSVIPHLPAMYGEPFADASAIPTHLMSALARKHVTVALSGDGGDELFCGYSLYMSAARYWSVVSRLSPVARSVLTGIAGSIPRVRDRYPALKEVLGSTSEVELYRALVSQWPGIDPGVLEFDADLATRSSHERMAHFDAQTFLPGEVLCKVDRAAMSVSLETRIPLLDHRVVEFAYSLPPRMKIRYMRGKWILREVLDKYVPRAITERPKMGFNVPIGRWLRGP